jgi:hypothetical protein
MEQNEEIAGLITDMIRVLARPIAPPNLLA